MKFNPRFSTLLATGLLLLVGVLYAAAKDKPDQEEHAVTGSIRVTEKISKKDIASHAKVSFSQALSTALATVPGDVIKGELEVEDHNLMYSFEIVTAQKEIKEVEVDAGNGKILDVDSD